MPHAATEPHLALSRVRFAHLRKGEAPKVILDGADMAVPRGAFALLTGPSGAGKSTLLRLFCRLEEPQEGLVLLNGESVAGLPPAMLRRRMSYLQQTPTVVPGSVRENLLLPFSFKAAAGEPKPDDAALSALLGRLAAGDIPLSQEASTLSVGQRQRLCLARALLTKPEVLLLDEPVSALDADSARAVLDAAEGFCLDDGGTVVLVSHADFAPARVSPIHFELAGGVLSWTRAS
jgi:putative ABC transport system ATP-binding protein